MIVWVVMPAYNEGARLRTLLGRWKTLFDAYRSGDHAHPNLAPRYVIVDDGSRDSTPDVLREFAVNEPLDVLTHTLNRGLGQTLRDALQFAAGQAQPDDVIVCMDADNTHSPDQLPMMLNVMNQSNCDVVIASRFRPGAVVNGVAPQRRLMTYGARILFQWAFRFPNVRDYTCGYRLYRAAIISRAFDALGPRFCDRPGFECTAQVLLQLAHLGATAHEIPLELQYELKRTASHMNIASTVRGTISLIRDHRKAWNHPSMR